MKDILKQLLQCNEKVLVALFISFKIAVLFLFPLSGDEAYFITWGKDIAPGYYDHPPVVGWVIYILSFISRHYLFYRFFAFLTPLIVSLFIYKLIATYKDREVALYVALAFFVSPISLFSFILTNDVVLLLFGFLGFYYFSRALEKSSISLSLLAGIFLGLTFLSKYLSVILLVSLLLDALIHRKKQSYKFILIMVAVVSIFIIEHIYFNLNHCWNNVVFNMISRTKEGRLNLVYTGYFFLSMIFLVPPYAVYLLSKVKIKNPPDFIRRSLYISIFVVVCFVIVSISQLIGLHWLALYIPFIYLLFALLPKEKLPLLIRYNTFLSIIVSIVLIIVSTQYSRIFSNHEKYKDIIINTETERVCEYLPRNETVFTMDYTENSMLSYYCKNNRFHVMLSLTKYGREDDKNIDFSQYEGKSMFLFLTNERFINDLKPYFASTKVSVIKANQKVNYYLIKGDDFNYEKYKVEILSTIAKNYYSPPDWLPEAKCGFKSKYSL